MSILKHRFNFHNKVDEISRLMIKPELWLDFSILLLFYGVYFGMITKDIADVCTDRMHSTMGFISDEGIPLKHLAKDQCGICGEKNIGQDEDGKPEKQVNDLKFKSI